MAVRDPSKSTADELFAQFFSMSAREQNRFCAFLINNRALRNGKNIEFPSLAGKMVSMLRQSVRTYKRRWKSVSQSKLDPMREVVNKLVSEINSRGDLIRKLKVKPRKKGRNFLIWDLLERGMDWKEILKHLLEHHPEWATVKKTGKVVSLKALKNDYKAWLKSNH